MAVLVTGSTGAVGSHVMLYLQMRKMDHFAYDLRSDDEPGEQPITALDHAILEMVVEMKDRLNA